MTQICLRLCDPCGVTGYCEQTGYPAVMDDELDQLLFRVDAANSVFFRISNLPYRVRPDFYADGQLRLKGDFVDNLGKRVLLDFDSLWDKNDTFWRDNFYPRRDANPPILRADNREAFRALFSLHRALYPDETLLWGYRVANDNSIERITP